MVDACQGAVAPVLRILTWNIFMMPPWIRESPCNEPRAAAIGATLREQSFDILCLQKAFDGQARDSLTRALGGDYPYRYGPINTGGSLKINGGVWVLSRHPLTDYREIQFDDCRGLECFSRKGAMLLSGRCGPTPFRLVATHLQGEEGPRFTVKNQRIRAAQMRAIQCRLVQPNLEPSVPFLICGDLGTPRFTDDGREETPAYREMLATFGAENGAANTWRDKVCQSRTEYRSDQTSWRSRAGTSCSRPSGVACKGFVRRSSGTSPKRN